MNIPDAVRKVSVPVTDLELWAFNDEKVVYAIYDSEIPVISPTEFPPPSSKDEIPSWLEREIWVMEVMNKGKFP